MKRRLSVENRMLIEQLLRLNYKLKDIAFYVDSTSSTVSIEIKNRRITGKCEFKDCEKIKRFPCICNGWRFSKPDNIEIGLITGEKEINVFYCEPYSSWQKSGIERNHEFIKYIIPKGITFDKLTNENIIDMMNHINNVSRRSIEYKTPYEIFNNTYGNNITKKLHLIPLKKDEVSLSYKLLIK